MFMLRPLVFTGMVLPRVNTRDLESHGLSIVVQTCSLHCGTGMLIKPVGSAPASSCLHGTHTVGFAWRMAAQTQRDFKLER